MPDPPQIPATSGRKIASAGACSIVDSHTAITLLALSDDGKPSYDEELSQKLAALGSPVFACTPDLFPDLMAAALKREDLQAWAAARDIARVRGGES